MSRSFVLVFKSILFFITVSLSSAVFSKDVFSKREWNSRERSSYFENHRSVSNENMHLGSLIMGGVIGFGTGHMVQSRWLDKGWLFTAGDIISLIFLNAHVFGPAYRGRRDRSVDWILILRIAGGVAYSSLKVWQIYDLIQFSPFRKAAHHPQEIQVFLSQSLPSFSGIHIPVLKFYF